MLTVVHPSGCFGGGIVTGGGGLSEGDAANSGGIDFGRGWFEGFDGEDESIGMFAGDRDAEANTAKIRFGNHLAQGFAKGRPISGLDEASATDGVVVFHAGTARDADGRLITAGGRVLGVTARAATLGAARDKAYEAIGKIHFEGLHYRRDIADRR